MKIDNDKPILPQLKYLGIEKDISVLMDFSCFNDETWEYIVIYFRVAIMTYYRSRHTRAELKEVGLSDGAISVMRKNAREHDLDYTSVDSIHPYILKYIKRFQHLGYRTALQKFKSDFLFYVWRNCGYNNAQVCREYKLTDAAVRRYLKPVKEIGNA